MDPELARRNVRLGWMLFGVFLLIFAGPVSMRYASSMKPITSASTTRRS